MIRVEYNARDYHHHTGEYELRLVEYLSPARAVELLSSLDWTFAAPSVRYTH